MKEAALLARFTLHELFRTPAMLVLMAMAFLINIAALVVSNLYLLELSKVQIDVLWTGTSILALAYVLFIATTLLAGDIAGQVAYLFLPKLNRQQYLLGRFAGLALGLVALMSLTAFVSGGFLAWTIAHTAVSYHAGASIWAGLQLAAMASLQGMTLLAAILFIASWATGQAETLVFSIGFTLLAYLLPPVVAAMQSHEVLERVPPAVAASMHIVDYILPDMTAGNMALAIAHGFKVSTHDIWLLIGQHGGYSLMMLAFALMAFARRDL